MRDISGKSNTLRTAAARATLRVAPATITAIKKGQVPKGDPLPVAKVAAIQAAKGTSQLIPYCHPIPVAFADCRMTLKRNEIIVDTEVKALYKTGVEMEALAAASAAALTLYDMLKMIDDSMEIRGIRLVRKTGGKSDFRTHRVRGLRAAVLVMSDSVSARRSRDESGRRIVQRLKDEGFSVAATKVVPDDPGLIRSALVALAARRNVDVILTTGGTGLGPRDRTPEATAAILDREAPGMAEILRQYGQERTPFSMLSRGTAGVRGRTLIVNLPGSPRGVAEALDALVPILHHAVTIIRGASHRGKSGH